MKAFTKLEFRVKREREKKNHLVCPKIGLGHKLFNV